MQHCKNMIIALNCIVYLCLFLTPATLGFRSIKRAGADLILAKAGETIDVVCGNEVPLVRCGFTHPNGTKVLFVDVIPGTPSCKFTTDVTNSETGLWTCHLWTPSSPQQEITKTLEVRVAHKFAALEKEVKAREGDRVTLSCVTSEGMFPLNECYFTSPEKRTIYMDDKITEENMIFNKYFFPRNLSVHRGDCSITFRPDPSAAGSWACSGWLELDGRLYTDYVHLTVYTEAWTEIDIGIDDEPIVISVPTFVCGSLAFLLIFAALLYWKEKYYTRFYGKTWGDDDSLENYAMAADSSQTLIQIRGTA